MNRILCLVSPILGLALLTACTPPEKDVAGGVGSALEPELLNSVEVLEKELRCTEFTHPERPPILLVHGTFTAGWEQYEWSYIPILAELGYDVCTTTYPDRGLGDMQNSAEYVVHAVRRIHEMTGQKVAIIGHSQGVAVPRWAIKWWPSVRNAVDDFVMMAGPNHGTVIADPIGLVGSVVGGLSGIELPIGSEVAPLPAAFHQFSPDSEFNRATNINDETPGDVSYTAIYSLFDELVQPATPIPTAAVDFGQDNPAVTNFMIQDLCTGYVVEHAALGLIDAVAFQVALDAINHPGPANIERAGGEALCGLPLLPSLSLNLAGAISGGAAIPPMEIENGLPSDLHLSVGEPPLRDYAQAALDAADAAAAAQ